MNILDIKLYRTIQNLVNPRILKDSKYVDTYLEGIKVRVFDPNKAKKIVIYIHGGGWVAGNLDTHSNICYKLANSLNRKVIAINYRLAPEYPYPVGLNDCLCVIKCIMNNLEYLGITYKDITIMGDSAGGNLTLAACLKDNFKVGNIVLIYPATQSDYSKNTKYKSIILNDGKGFLTRKRLEEYILLYAPLKEDRQSKFVNLLQAKRLFGLTKTLIITGTNDPLHDEGVALAKKLKRHFVRVKHYDLNGAYHGFMTNVLDKKFTELTIELIKGFIGD